MFVLSCSGGNGNDPGVSSICMLNRQREKEKDEVSLESDDILI